MINELYKYIEQNKIDIVEDSNYVLDKLKGMYDQDTDTILLSKRLTEEELKYVLLEEIAHREVGVIPTFIFSNADKIKRSRNEYKALKYCYSKLIPKDNINRLYDMNMTLYEASEELGITEEFIKRSYELIRRDYELNICEAKSRKSR